MNIVDFPFQTEIEVSFRDLDPMGHVNNAVYFTYIETARGRFMGQFFDIRKPLDIPLILGEASCRYILPLLFGECVRVKLGISRFGTKSFDMVYRLEGGDGRLVATARSTMIMFDYARGQSIPVPESFKAQVAAFQGHWPPPA